jgi:hypothetical protein
MIKAAAIPAEGYILSAVTAAQPRVAHRPRAAQHIRFEAYEAYMQNVHAFLRGLA